MYLGDSEVFLNRHLRVAANGISRSKTKDHDMEHDEKSLLKGLTSENNQFMIGRRDFIGKFVFASIDLMLPNYLNPFAKIAPKTL